MAIIDSRPDANNGNGAVDGYIKTDDKPNGVSVTSQTTNAPKRKYRRHPKVSFHILCIGLKSAKHLLVFQPDENAPERPPSAYVLFSNRK